MAGKGKTTLHFFLCAFSVCLGFQPPGSVSFTVHHVVRSLLHWCWWNGTWRFFLTLLRIRAFINLADLLLPWWGSNGGGGNNAFTWKKKAPRKVGRRRDELLTVALTLYLLRFLWLLSGRFCFGSLVRKFIILFQFDLWSGSIRRAIWELIREGK